MSDLRMPDLNNVTLAGRLTRDPELRALPNAVFVCKFGLAVSRKYKNKDETLFINATAWQKLAEFCGQSLHKGDPVIVEGRLRCEEWDDKNTGQKRTSFEVQVNRVQMLSWPKSDKSETSNTQEPDRDETPF